MTSILEQQVTAFLTTELGRAPTAAEIANGLLAPRSLSVVHNALNVTQSILAVSPGDDLQSNVDELVLNGGGTLFLNPGTYNLTNNLVLDSNIRLQGVGSVGSTIDFGGGAYQIQIIGSLGNNIVSPSLAGLTVKNSSTDLVKGQYVTNFSCNDLTSSSGLTGLKLLNVDTANIYSSLQDSCGTGLVATDSDFFTIFSSNVTGCTSGGGVSLTNITNSTSIACSVDACVGGGYIFDGCSDFGFEDFAITNITGIGVNFTNSSFAIGVLDGFIDTCSSDGMKIQGSSNNLQIAAANTFSNNGGYGIDIAAGSSNILIVANSFVSNSSGAVNDGGTATKIRSNIGVADN